MSYQAPKMNSEIKLKKSFFRRAKKKVCCFFRIGYTGQNLDFLIVCKCKHLITANDKCLIVNGFRKSIVA